MNQILLFLFLFWKRPYFKATYGYCQSNCWQLEKHHLLYQQGSAMLIEILNQYSRLLWPGMAARDLTGGVEKAGWLLNCPDEMDRWIDAPHDLPGV